MTKLIIVKKTTNLSININAKSAITYYKMTI